MAWRGEKANSVRVLIVDDSRLARTMLKQALPRALATDVVEATTGTEALQWATTSHIDLMFLDLTMPDRDGYQVLRSLQEAGQMPPTIVVSADVQAMAVERVLKLGALAFLKKTFKPSELADTLQRAGLL
jgi:two-component system, chemotaxis family, chemotaxis protein CheY